MSFQDDLDLINPDQTDFMWKPHKILHKKLVPAGLQSTVCSANEVIMYLRHLPMYGPTNNTSDHLEAILKTNSRWQVFPQVAARAPQ